MVACAGAACNFARDYEIAQEPLMREIERCVRGSDYGATSWTTREQAEQAAARLGLVRGLRLLELGAGSGWPALFLAMLSGCDVALTDLPLSGLRIARERAARDGLDSRCSVLAADGATLPFADHSFDCIHHADVLCCMDRKREMLHECRRVARVEARMEFSVISLARESADDDERRLLQRGVAIVMPNIHGSTGYGKAWQARIHRDWGGIDLADLRSVAEWMRAQRDFDPERLGVFGGSYGGFACLTCVHVFRFHRPVC